jgi:hypothetical protein
MLFDGQSKGRMLVDQLYCQTVELRFDVSTARKTSVQFLMLIATWIFMKVYCKRYVFKTVDILLELSVES